MTARIGKPHVIYTEFISVAGLCSRGRQRLLPDLQFSAEERPIVVQFFGRDPEQFRIAAGLAREWGFDGVDINLGCPDKSVLRQGAGASLIREPELVAEIVAAAREGGGLPVSVKTRIGYTIDEVEKWIPALAAIRPAAIALHGRTRRQRYLGMADWDAIARAAALLTGSGIPLIGNGDVHDMGEARARAAASGVDGVMIGRAVLGNPWVFREDCRRDGLPLATILATAVEHARLYHQLYSGCKQFANMRKQISAYLSGFPHAKELRRRLLFATDPTVMEGVVREFLESCDP
jgi:nifR3 family TIM-barrel protein